MDTLSVPVPVPVSVHVPVSLTCKCVRDRGGLKLEGLHTRPPSRTWRPVHAVVARARARTRRSASHTDSIYIPQPATSVAIRIIYGLSSAQGPSEVAMMDDG